jgi:putative nucleotidyltransferase with HDIG domain
MPQATIASNGHASQGRTRTPQARGRRLELLLWISGLVLLCVAWTITIQVITHMRDSAVRSMQFAQLQTLKALTGNLEFCTTEHALLRHDTLLDPVQATQHCLEPLVKLDDWQIWVIPADVILDETLRADAPALNADLIPYSLFTELLADQTDAPTQLALLREGSGSYSRNPAVGAEIFAWTTTQFDNRPWVVGVATPAADMLAATGIQQQALIMVALLAMSTLIGLLLMTMTVASVRRQHEAEQALTDANATLESHVAQRTAALVAANREMKQEITRRLQVEEALHASEERSRSLLNAIPDLLFVLDSSGSFLEARGSPDARQHQTVITAVGTNLRDHCPIAEDLPQVQAAIRTALANGATQEVTYHTDHPQAGRQVWTARLTAINPREVLMLARNITAYSHALETIERVNQEVLSAYDATLLGWSRMLEVRENEVAGHSQRVAALTVQLAARLGCTDAEITQIRRGALLHDIGKMALPDTILRKAGALTEEERRLVQQHPDLAYSWLSGIAFLRPALDIPYCHHERWNGAGYPRGLRGIEIPLAARIFSVVDVWDALLADRPYKARWTPGAARAYLREQAGELFDPRVVEEFLHMVGEEPA